jgi:hypothetical protein
LLLTSDLLQAASGAALTAGDGGTAYIWDVRAMQLGGALQVSQPAREPGQSVCLSYAPGVYGSSVGQACSGRPARARVTGPHVLFGSTLQVAGGLSVHALHVHCEEGEARGLLLGLADGAVEIWGAAHR